MINVTSAPFTLRSSYSAVVSEVTEGHSVSCFIAGSGGVGRRPLY